MVIKTNYATYEGVYLKVAKYQIDNSLAIEAWNRNEGAIARLTVCLCDRSLADDEAYVDTNNCPWVVEFIEKEKLGKRIGKMKRSGFCIYPAVKFDMEQVRKREMEE